ncbi:TetR/AcrR family transcriptional regulator [Conexibacter woesei]|uniref:TetR/AcrR family transcriptional regulator n=1 Tax=Conexibacter woesei TaxID=191495 RepID=UPI0011D269DD|nr:TetR/AcrR family transcriptional regulator [Conexibacter woesei]
MSTRDRLSIEAARMFAERGYHGTSIGDLAGALGIRKASVYTHINGKEELLAQIALAGATAFHAALDAVPEDAAPGERLRLALRAHLGVVDRQLDVATVWLQEWRYLTGDARRRFLAERRRYERRVTRLHQDAVDAGALRADLDVRHAVLVFLSVGNWAYTWMSRGARVGETADALWSLLLEGTAPRR